MNQEQQRYQRAHERVEAIKGFYVHATIFALVNLGLFVINWVTPGPWWFYWPLIGWSVALGINALVVFVFGGTGPWGEAWEERKTREVMEKEEVENRPLIHKGA
jgi:hypothetical protein